MTLILIAILILLGCEGLGLAVYRFRENQLASLVQDLANLCAGAFFVALALNLPARELDPVTLACLAGAGVAHVAEVVLRLRSQRHSKNV